MILDGRKQADQILQNLKAEVEAIKHDHNITPAIAVILVGDDPSSQSFVKQKQKAADAVGAKLIFHHLPLNTPNNDINAVIDKANNDPSIHAVIVQRPVPVSDMDAIHLILPTKDIDGFVPYSLFTPPVAEAVIMILDTIRIQVKSKESLSAWLKSQSVTVIGRGETAGTPTINALTKLGVSPSVIHSQTPDPKAIMKQSDILISCVGKKDIIKASSVKPGAIVIGVGIWRDESGKYHGDYDEQEVAPITSYFTPTPGGVGPVNVACLMKNVVKACKMSITLSDKIISG